ncbi:MAG TPA: hypothetical protein VFI33_17815 [Puia sp.]|nr:hypothetical protein [Puia sp.]
MTVKKKMLLLISISVIQIITFSLSSCNNEHNPKALRDLYNKVTYDTTIINHIALYDSLKNILIHNLDTIFKFRDARTPVYHGSGPDSDRATYDHRDFYMFFLKWDSSAEISDNYISLKTLPAYVYPAVKRSFEVLGKDRIGGFMIWDDGAIEIPLPKSFIDANTRATVRHLLRWKRTVDNSDWPLTRDSIIAPGWTYEIAVLEHEER